MVDEGNWRAAREDMLGARACGARGRGRADADACTAQWRPWVRAHAKAGGASEAVEAEPALWCGVTAYSNAAIKPCCFYIVSTCRSAGSKRLGVV